MDIAGNHRYDTAPNLIQVFGAEVFSVSKYAEKDRCLSMIKPTAAMNSHAWIIENFSAITENVLYLDYFKVGKFK